MMAQCGAGGQPKLDLICTHTRLSCRSYMRKFSEPVDLPLLVSQTKYNWSLALDEAEVDSATHDMVAQCGAGSQPLLELLRKHTRLSCCCNMRRWSEPVDLPLLVSQTKYNWSLALDAADVDSTTHCDGPIWCWRRTQIGPTLHTYVAAVTAVQETMVCAV